jgi:hypothetical protein
MVKKTNVAYGFLRTTCQQIEFISQKAEQYSESYIVEYEMYGPIAAIPVISNQWKRSLLLPRNTEVPYVETAFSAVKQDRVSVIGMWVRGGG